MLVRFDPFREFERMTQDVFDGRRRSSALPLDIHRHGDEFRVSIDLPGVDPESIEVTVENNLLTVNASRQWQKEEGDSVIVRERVQGTFTRRLRLSQQLDAEKVHASYNRGVLTLVVPVAEVARSRRIPISSGAAVEPEVPDAGDAAAA